MAHGSVPMEQSGLLELGRQQLAAFGRSRVMNTGLVARDRHIQLPYVRRTGGPPFRGVLSRRASCREFLQTPLDLQTIADLLWAAFGINRPEDGGRTAPSARNWREIEIWVALPEALYRYNAALNQLEFMAAGDLRAATGEQTFVAHAPLNLIYVADYSKMEGSRPPTG